MAGRPSPPAERSAEGRQRCRRSRPSRGTARELGRFGRRAGGERRSLPFGRHKPDRGEQAAAEALVRAGHTVRLLDPWRVRAFARAVGQRAKTDPIDARVIARYVGETDGAMPPPDPAREHLRVLVAQRTALIAQRKAREQQVDLQDLLQPLLAQVASAIAGIESLILTALKAGAQQRARAALLLAVPGVGPILTATLLARLPELGHLASRKIAALAGLAPYDRPPVPLAGRRAGAAASATCASASMADDTTCTPSSTWRP